MKRYITFTKSDVLIVLFTAAVIVFVYCVGLLIDAKMLLK